MWLTKPFSILLSEFVSETSKSLDTSKKLRNYQLFRTYYYLIRMKLVVVGTLSSRQENRSMSPYSSSFQPSTGQSQTGQSQTNHQVADMNRPITQNNQSRGIIRMTSNQLRIRLNSLYNPKTFLCCHRYGMKNDRQRGGENSLSR